MNKLFIIGLPRTGTTSISVALLDYGFKVAHTAFTKRAFELADVISDAPCFCDYKELDKLFPGSKFVYLERSLESWIPSIQMLLKKMLKELDQKTGYLHPVLKRCFNTSFALSVANHLDEEHLKVCYLSHQQSVLDYFAHRSDFLKIDVSQSESLQSLLKFLDIDDNKATSFPHTNVGKQVDSWKQIKHPNKINALVSGKEHRKFFQYPI
ncbi:MAG: sulfotransferase family protein [Cellvibrio sp.]